MKNNPIDLGIITAMPIEMEALLPWLSHIEKVKYSNSLFIKGNIGGKNIVLCVSGMGQTNAAITTMQICYHFDPTDMIYYGIAGAILPDLKIGDVVVGKTIIPLDIQLLYDFNKVRQCNFSELPESKFISDKHLVDSFTKTNPNCIVGTLATSDYFPYPINMPDSFEETPILSIDMESSAFAQSCKKMNKPFIVIRAISNIVNYDTDFSGIPAECINIAAEKAAERTAAFILNRDICNN